MTYQLEEEMKNVQIMQDQVLSLNSKVKKLRENLGDAVRLFLLDLVLPIDRQLID